MSDITVARRYAQALYTEAQAQGNVEQVDEDIEMIRATMDGSRELVRLFESPVISREKKQRVFEELFAEKVQPLTLRFMNLLAEKEREAVFPAVVTAYGQLRDRELGITEAHARVAFPLDDASQEKLVAALERMTGRRVRLAVREDASILGGIVVRVGDTVYDGSVRHQLADLLEQLEHGS